MSGPTTVPAPLLNAPLTLLALAINERLRARVRELEELLVKAHALNDDLRAQVAGARRSAEEQQETNAELRLAIPPRAARRPARDVGGGL